MALSSTTNRNDYTADGSTSQYPYTFVIVSDTDLLVTVRDTSNVETTLTLYTDYTVAGTGEANGGSITLTAGNLTIDYAITIRRVRPLTQETDIRNQGAFFPEIHENSFDNATMVDQQMQDQVDRSIKTQETDYSDTMYLPVTSERAGKYLAFDSDGNPIASAGSADGIAVTPYMEELLGDDDDVSARITLGFNGTNPVGNVSRGNLDDAVVTALIPTGTILLYGGTPAPTGFLSCDGQAYSRTDYSALFGIIGTNFGVGDGSTTFNVPNFSRRVPVGAGGSGTGTLANSVGSTGGEETHVLTIPEMPLHDHSYVYTGTGAGDSFAGGSDVDVVDNSGTTGGTGGSQSHNNMQPSLVVNYIIKS